MATRVKRLALGVVALAAIGGVGAGPVAAQTATTTTSTTAPATTTTTLPEPAPTATFSSPTSAPANQAIWVRSITPCPAPTPGVASIVVARIVDEVTASELSASATAVRSDGDWDATLVAPPGPLGDGTIGFLVEAQCLTRAQRPDAEPIVRQKYVLRTLTVTSGAAGESLGWVDGRVGGVATTTTTTTVATTAPAATTGGAGSLQVPGSTPTAAPSGTPTTSGGVPTKSSYVSAGQVQAEIAAQAALEEVRANADPADYVSLNASPASAARAQEPSGAGIPAWSFACAAALAVGAVLAWGQRRSTAIEAVRTADVDE